MRATPQRMRGARDAPPAASPRSAAALDALAKFSFLLFLTNILTGELACGNTLWLSIGLFNRQQRRVAQPPTAAVGKPVERPKFSIGQEGASPSCSFTYGQDLVPGLTRARLACAIFTFQHLGQPYPWCVAVCDETTLAVSCRVPGLRDPVRPNIYLIYWGGLTDFDNPRAP